MIAIRVDSNKHIGLGHVMRCLSIADIFKENNNDILFIVCDSECEEIIKNRGFNCIKLSTSYDNLENELNEIKEIIYRYKISKLLIDSYYVTDNYLKNLKQICKTIYINDFLKFKYDVDAIINYNIFSENINYLKYYKENQIFKGTKYAPLSKEYINTSYEVKENVENILITTGGTDINGVNKLILDRIIESDEFKNINFNVVIGKYFSISEEEKDNYRKYANINLLENIEKISKILNESDIVISAAGFTMYEICSIGVPCILLSNGSNLVSEEFMKANSIIYGGDFNKFNLDLLFNHIQNLICDYDKRKMLSDNCKKIVDGKGAFRIAQLIINL